MSSLEKIDQIIDICSPQQLESVFASISDLPDLATKAEMISHCLNVELGAYGLKTYVSPDKTSVFINDDGMGKVLNFFQGKGYQPVLTQEHTERVGTVVNFAKENTVDLLWAPGGLKKSYYFFKQYGFNGVNLYHYV